MSAPGEALASLGARSSRAAHWLLAVAPLAALALYAETVFGIVRVWLNSPDFAHGPLVVLVSAWLVWRERTALAGMSRAVHPRGLLWTAAAVLVWLCASVAGVAVVEQLALVAIASATVLTVAGPAIAGRLVFPLGFLVFAVPWGHGVLPLLQDLTARLAVSGLGAVGVPAALEGRHIVLPEGRFVVVEACAGLPYLLVLLAVGCLYAWHMYRDARRRVLFAAATIVAAVLANAARAGGIVLTGYLGGMELAGRPWLHSLLHWLVFGGVLLALLVIGRHWRQPRAAVPVRAAGRPVDATMARRTTVTLALAAVLAAGPATLAWSRAQAAVAVPTRVPLPAAAPGWRAAPLAASALGPVFPGASAVAAHRFVDGSGEPAVELLRVHYRVERQGAELIGAHSRLHGPNWRRIAWRRGIVAPAGERIVVNQLVIGRGGLTRLAWYWYAVGERATAWPAAVKLLVARDQLTAAGTGTALVAISTPVPDGPIAAHARLARFLDAHGQLLRGRRTRPDG